MKNLRYHFPTCYAYYVIEPIGELNLKSALDEDTGVFSSFLHVCMYYHFVITKPQLSLYYVNLKEEDQD